MMKKRKYRFSRFAGVYVSSSGNYTLEIKLYKNSLISTYWLDDNGNIFNNLFSRYVDLPKYIVAVIKENLKHYINKGEIFYYEYNQQEEKRFQNLRYTEPEVINKQFLDWVNE